MTESARKGLLLFGLVAGLGLAGCADFGSGPSPQRVPAPAPTSLTWAGLHWNLVSKDTPNGSGPNLWSADNVTVDAQGCLHLKITQVNGQWYCAELVSVEVLGFGTYQWQVQGPVGTLDPNVVLGLFPRGGSGFPVDTNELDVEFSRWGSLKNNIGNFTVWPFTAPATGPAKYSSTFPVTLDSTQLSTSRMTWSSGSVDFSFQAHGASAPTTWSLATTPVFQVPQGPMAVRLNLWLFNGQAPTDGKPIEVVLTDFTFKPQGS